MYCPRCGSSTVEIKRENHGEVRGEKGKKNLYETVAFCKSCGMTWDPNYVSPPPSPKKKKKPIYQRVWFWIIIGLLVIGMFSPKDKTTTEETKNIPTEEVSNTDSITAEETELVIEEDKQIVEEVTSVSETTPSMSIEEVVSFIDTVVLYPNAVNNPSVTYSIEYNDGGIFISTSTVGLTAEVWSIKNGYLPVSDWNDLVNATIEMQKSIQTLVNNYGYSDIPVTVMVLNDQNKNKVLLIITAETVVYDVVNEIDIFGIENN